MQFHQNGFKPGDPEIFDRSERKDPPRVKKVRSPRRSMSLLPAVDRQG